jgi:hypothetical protein
MKPAPTYHFTRRPGLYSTALVFAVALAACRAQAAPTPASAVKIFISEAGLYRLSRADLQAAGFDLAAAGDSLSLRHRDQEVPLQVETAGDDEAVLFYAAPQSSEFSRADVYWLSQGADGARIASRSVEPPRDDRLPVVFQATTRFEEDKLYYPNAAGDTHWYWLTLTAPSSQALTLNLPAFAGGPALLEIRLAGVTEGDHRVQVSVNDAPAGEASWSGAVPYAFQVSSSILRGC